MCVCVCVCVCVRVCVCVGGVCVCVDTLRAGSPCKQKHCEVSSKECHELSVTGRHAVLDKQIVIVRSYKREGM